MTRIVFCEDYKHYGSRFYEKDGRRRTWIRIDSDDELEVLDAAIIENNYPSTIDEHIMFIESDGKVVNIYTVPWPDDYECTESVIGLYGDYYHKWEVIKRRIHAYRRNKRLLK